MVNSLQFLRVYSLQAIPVKIFLDQTIQSQFTHLFWARSTANQKFRATFNILNIKLKKTQNFNYNFKFDNGSTFHLEQRRLNENDILTDLDDLI